MAQAVELNRVLSAYSPISLSEMDSVSLMNRVDTKYVLGEDDLQHVLESQLDCYRVLEVQGHRSSLYTTLYFDTPTRQCYREHHNGKTNRQKYRMRRYASSGASFFEVKTKTNKGRTEKQRIPILSIDSPINAESAALAESIAGTPLTLEPMIRVTFRRLTLVGQDAPERITIDTGLRFTTGERQVSLPGLVIAELKQACASRGSAIRQKLRGLGIRSVRLSKYCLGTALLDPSLKRNAFKQQVRAIHNTLAAEARR